MKKSLLIGMSSLLLFTTLSYAKVSFKDITTDYWGYDYIDFTADKGIINGFPDGTFQPASAVTKEQSLAMIYRSLKAAGLLKSSESYVKEHSSIMDENAIAEWARPFVAYALEYDIIKETELKTFTKDELGIPASRQEVAVWASKALDKAISPLYSLNYVDKDTISQEAVPYIDLMYRYEIMMGDDTNQFRPDSTITRAEFAAVCSRVYQLGDTDVYDIDKEGDTFNGIIKDIKGNQIVFENAVGEEKNLIISDEAGIIINGKKGTLKQIKDNTKAMIAYNNAVDNKSILIWTKEDLYSGIVKDLEEIEDATYKVIIKNIDGDDISYILNEASEIYDENNNKISTSRLTFGDNVKYTCDGIKILEVKILDK